MAGLDGAPPSKKRQVDRNTAMLSADLDFDGPELESGETDLAELEENEDEDLETGGEARLGSEEPGKDVSAKYATLYSSLD